MFAVIKTGGRQYRVVPDDVLEIGKIAGDVGTIVQLGEVLLVGGDTPVLGAPTVAGATVAAEVLQHKRGPKVISFKKRRRKNSRRKRGYRDEITVLRITEILTDDKQADHRTAAEAGKAGRHGTGRWRRRGAEGREEKGGAEEGGRQEGCGETARQARCQEGSGEEAGRQGQEVIKVEARQKVK